MLCILCIQCTMSELEENINAVIQTMDQFNVGGDNMHLDIGGNQAVTYIVEKRTKQALLKNYADMMLHVPGALEWVMANPIKKPWSVHRNISFIEAHAVNCDNMIYEEMTEFREEFEPLLTEEVEDSRAFLESCNEDAFKTWCDETIGESGSWNETHNCGSLNASFWENDD